MKLKPRRDPYWQRLAKGCFLGFRRMTTSSEGTWSARFYLEAEARQVHHPLGDMKELPQHMRFDAAVKAADQWFRHLGKGGRPEFLTVLDACTRYVEHLRSTKGAIAAHDAQSRFSRYVVKAPQGFAGIELVKLQPVHLERWRKWLHDEPINSGARKGEQRSASALNRDLTPLRAALNRAIGDGLVEGDFAWRQNLKPIPNAGTRRDVYLSKEQRMELRESARQDIAQFILVACALPLRCGAIANLTVGDFDPVLRTLRIGVDKFGAGRRVALPTETAALIQSFCGDKPPSARVLTQQNGNPWNKDAWKDVFKVAAVIAELPLKSVMTTLRHTAITDLMHAGVDSLTVSQISGTSMAMIERHYGHLTREHAKIALEKLLVV